MLKRYGFPEYYLKFLFYCYFFTYFYLVVNFEYKLVKEVTPIQMNMIIFIFVSFLVWLWSTLIIHLCERILFKFISESKLSEIFYFTEFQIFNTFVFYVIIAIVPSWATYWFEWLNYRAIISIVVLNIPYKILNNIVFKCRKFGSFTPLLYILIADIAVYSITRYPLLMIKDNILNCSHLMFAIAFALMVAFTKFQYLYGSRFFLPNRCRYK